MRFTKLALAFLLSFSLVAPPSVTAASQGRGPGAERAQNVAKKAQKEKKQKKVKKAKKENRAKKQANDRKPHKAQKPAKAQKPHKAQKPNKPRDRKAGEQRAAERRDVERRATRQRAAVREDRRERRELRQERRADRPERVERRDRRELRQERRADRPERIERRERRERRQDRSFDRDRRDRVTRRAPGAEPLRFRGMDRDGDRRITRAEWRGNDVSFRNHDWNRDGVLSGSEVMTGARRDAALRFERRARLARQSQQHRMIRHTRRDEVTREQRMLRQWYGPDAVRTSWREATDLRFYRDGFGHRVVLAPRPLAQGIAQQYALTRRTDLTRVPLRNDMVLVDFGLTPPPTRRVSESLFDRLALPLTLMVTNALLGEVDDFVIDQRFSSYDRDLDGYLTPLEWSPRGARFDHWDRDGDGMLVQRELFADETIVVVDRDRVLLYQGLDRDDDGLLAPWEWPGDLDSFWFRDFNADGAVSLDEYLGLEVDRPVRQLDFDAVDFDRDGNIARVEWVGDPYRFHQLDRNGNGVVGRWEYAFGWLRGA